MLHEDSLKKTDPEFMERWKAFACDEVVNEPDQQLDDPTRYLAIMAALTGSQSIDAFKAANWTGNGIRKRIIMYCTQQKLSRFW